MARAGDIAILVLLAASGKRIGYSFFLIADNQKQSIKFRVKVCSFQPCHILDRDNADPVLFRWQKIGCGN